MSCSVLIESARLAAVTACTTVDRAGLVLSAVTTGSVAIAASCPGPRRGRRAQPAPNGWSEGTAAVVSALSLALLAVLEDALLSAGSSEPQALSARVRPATAAMRTPRVRGVRFTWMGLLVRSVRPHCAGPGRGGRQPAVTSVVCHPVAPAGNGSRRASGCTSPSPLVARTVIV